MPGRNVILSAFVGLIFSGCAGAVPSNLGAPEGILSPCPDSPNCVSSQSKDPGHAVSPLPYTGTADEVISDLKTIVNQIKRSEIQNESPSYLHVTFKSFLFRFIDDVEFALDENENLIHIRSASRTGYSDLGVNRRRLEKIRELWERR